VVRQHDGLGDLVPREMRLKALKKIYDFNVLKFAKGEMGAVNGMAARWQHHQDQRAGAGGVDGHHIRGRRAHVE
jgi:familyl 116 glycosyl hydrolase-like protein